MTTTEGSAAAAGAGKNSAGKNSAGKNSSGKNGAIMNSAVADYAISVRGLRMSYGTYEAVRGIDFDVEPGEILAFLGPNGAGKTTTTEILEGFRKRTGGEVTVLGADPGRAWLARADRGRAPGQRPRLHAGPAGAAAGHLRGPRARSPCSSCAR